MYAIAFKAYDIISILTAVEQRSYPNINAITRKLCNSNEEVKKKLFEYGKQCIDPSIEYYKQLVTSMKTPLAVFKAARLFCPTRLNEIYSSKAEVILEELRVIPFLDSNTMEHLKDEFPTYCALTKDVSPTIDTCKFWKNYADTLPHLASVAAKLATIQPSSASVERVFSLLTSFCANQSCTLEDCIEASLMLQLNNSEV